MEKMEKNEFKKSYVEVGVSAFRGFAFSCPCDSSKSLISDYTKFVESVEVAAENGDTHLLESFSAEFDKFEARKAELLKKAAVSKAESDELEKLSGRYAAAVAKLSIKKAADSVGNFLDGLLGN